MWKVLVSVHLVWALCSAWPSRLHALWNSLLAHSASSRASLLFHESDPSVFESRLSICLLCCIQLLCTQFFICKLQSIYFVLKVTMRIYLDYVSKEPNTMFGTWRVGADKTKHKTKQNKTTAVTFSASMTPYDPGCILSDLCIFQVSLPSVLHVHFKFNKAKREHSKTREWGAPRWSIFAHFSLCV